MALRATSPHPPSPGGEGARNGRSEASAATTPTRLAATRHGDRVRHLIDNQLHAPYTGEVTATRSPAPTRHAAPGPLTLETLPRRQAAIVGAIEWARLASPEARRLRELGFDEGVAVEVLHRARLGGGPIACRIGRMTVALRRAVARAISVSPDALPAE